MYQYYRRDTPQRNTHIKSHLIYDKNNTSLQQEIDKFFKIWCQDNWIKKGSKGILVPTSHSRKNKIHIYYRARCVLLKIKLKNKWIII